MKTTIFTTLLILASFGLRAQVAINNDNSNPDPSAMLDVKSIDKGMLVPRLTSTQREAIASPANGLLVFDSTTESFWFYSNPQWTELKDGSINHVLSDMDGDTRIDVEESTNEDTIRFYIAGQEIMHLDSNRLSIATSDSNLVIGHDAGLFNNKSFNTLLGIRAGYSNVNGIRNTFLGYGVGEYSIGFENTFIGNLAGYKSETSLSVLIGDRSGENNKGFENVYIGYDAGRFDTIGGQNVYIGNEAGKRGSGAFNTNVGYYAGFANTGADNTFLGAFAGQFDKSGFNTYIGSNAGVQNDGIANVLLGYSAGSNMEQANKNTFLGAFAGKTSSGDSSVFIGYRAGYSESSSQKLYIENSDADAANALIYGEFDNDLLSINGNLGINTQAPEGAIHVKHNGSSTNPQLILYEDNASDYARLTFQNTSGSTRWTISGKTSNTNSNAELNFYNSSFGGDIMSLKGTGKVGIGTTSPSDRLQVNSDLGEDALRVQVNGATKMRIHDNGSITVGGNFGTSYALALQNNVDPLIGQARANAWTTYSDSRIKSNQQPISYGLKEVLQLQPKSYLHHSSEYTEEGLSRLKGAQSEATIGFIAQEVQQIIPEVVYEPENKSEDLWGIDYTKLIPVLTKAIQEQQDMIRDQQDQINEMAKKLETLMNN